MSEIEGVGSTAPVSAPESNPLASSATTSESSEPVLFEDLGHESNIKKQKEKKADLPAESVESLKADGKDKEAKPKKETKEDKPKAEKSGSEEKQAQLEAKKLLKARAQDKEYEFEEDAVVSVKIDGKDVDVPIKDLLSNYSGKTAWDKRFSELDKERKTYLKMKDESESKIKSIFEEQDPEMRFYKMAEFAGANPLEVRRKFLEENLNLLEKWYSMSEDERRADELSYENRYLKHQQETMQRQARLGQAKAQLESQVKSMMATHKIEQNQFVDRYNEIESLVEQGKLGADKLTPEFITESIS